MNEKLQEALAKILEKTTKGVEGSIELLSGELPELINQILIWYALESFIWFSIGAAGLVAFKVKFKAISAYRESVDDYDLSYGASYAGQVAWIIISTTLTLSNYTWIKILVAPKLYLIEYAARMAS